MIDDIVLSKHIKYINDMIAASFAEDLDTAFIKGKYIINPNIRS